MFMIDTRAHALIEDTIFCHHTSGILKTPNAINGPNECSEVDHPEMIPFSLVLSNNSSLNHPLHYDVSGRALYSS